MMDAPHRGSAVRFGSLVIFAAVVAIPLFGVGCAHVPSRAECSLHEGSAWREVTSAHFRLKTNLDSKTARDAALQLERWRKALLVAWEDKIDPPGRLDAIVLQSREQLREFSQRDPVPFFATDVDGPFIVLTGQGYAFDASPSRRQLNHELAHYLSSYALLRQPRWVAEGFATYLETTSPYGDGSQVRIGEDNRAMLAWNRIHAPVSWEDLWNWKGDENLSQDARHSLYAASWLWVHFLLNKHPERFGDFQVRLGRAEDPRKAWNAAFAGIPHGELNREIGQYLRRGTYSAVRFPMPAIETDVAERPMSDAEVHMVRARLWIAKFEGDRQKSSELSRQEVAEALARDRHSLEARVWQIRAMASSDDERLRLARELTGLHPDRSEAWKMLTHALFGRSEFSGERRDAAVKAVQLAPDDPEALNSLAWDYHLAGTPRPGLPLAQKAARIAPWGPAILDTWAALLADAGSCDQAALVQRRAVDMLREGLSAKRRVPYEEALARYEAGCQPPETAPSRMSSDSPP
jgi:hypothetical protein